MAWLMLVVAGLLETGFAVSLKYSEGFTRPVPTILFVVLAAGSLALLMLALRSLPVGTAYAVWTGIGAAGTALVGMLFLGEPAQLLRMLSIGLIVVAVAGLQLSGSAHA